MIKGLLPESSLDGLFARGTSAARFDGHLWCIYNMVCCPLTTQIKGYPFEVEFKLDGVPCAVLADQVKSLDWRSRRAKHKGKVDQKVLDEIQAKLKLLLGIR